jgi:hypothetical protein
MAAEMLAMRVRSLSAARRAGISSVPAVFATFRAAYEPFDAAIRVAGRASSRTSRGTRSSAASMAAQLQSADSGAPLTRQLQSSS